jgi:hypothetical protein
MQGSHVFPVRRDNAQVYVGEASVPEKAAGFVVG